MKNLARRAATAALFGACLTLAVLGAVAAIPIAMYGLDWWVVCLSLVVSMTAGTMIYCLLGLLFDFWAQDSLDETDIVEETDNNAAPVLHLIGVDDEHWRHS